MARSKSLGDGTLTKVEACLTWGRRRYSKHFANIFYNIYSFVAEDGVLGFWGFGRLTRSPSQMGVQENVSSDANRTMMQRMRLPN